MEIQQHDGVVVETAVISAGLRQAQREGEVSREGKGGARARVWPRGVACPPSQVGRPPPLGFPTLCAGGGPRGVHQPTRGWFPSHLSPWGPPG